MKIVTYTVTAAIDPATQVPPTGTSNLYDVIINIDGLNDCDEFDDGDNNVDCNHVATYLVGPVSQTNNPNVNPVGTNEIDIVTDDNMLNGCAMKQVHGTLEAEITMPYVTT